MPHLRGEVLGAPLTPREQEVLARYAACGHQATIAADLDLSTQTIKNHLSHAYAKLGVGTGVEAMAIMGWLSIPTQTERAIYDAEAAFAQLRDDLADLLERSSDLTSAIEDVLTDSPQDAPVSEALT